MKKAHSRTSFSNVHSETQNIRRQNANVLGSRSVRCLLSFVIVEFPNSRYMYASRTCFCYVVSHAAISYPMMLYRNWRCFIGSAAYGSIGRYVVYGHMYFTDIYRTVSYLKLLAHLKSVTRLRYSAFLLEVKKQSNFLQNLLNVIWSKSSGDQKQTLQQVSKAPQGPQGSKQPQVCLASQGGKAIQLQLNCVSYSLPR